MGWLERIAPQWARNRARARYELDRLERIREIHKRAYEGSSTSRRMQWLGHGDAPAGANAFTLKLLRERSRDKRINSPHLANAVETIAANVVGAGIVPRIETPRGQARLATRLWKAWGETPECDADACLDFYGLQDLVMQSLVESGEVLVRRRVRRLDEGLSTPIQLQVLEPDMLADDMGPLFRRPDGRNVIKSGIEFNRKGQRVAYHLRRVHPGEQDFDRRTIRVPASEILHIYRCTRPGQIRGVPWAAPVLTRLAMLDDYEDAALERARVSACFVAFVTEPNPLGGIEPHDPNQEAELYDKVEPGQIERLTPGQDVKFGQPPQDNTYESFTTTNKRAIASGMGITYEQLTGDLSGVNFSSGRMGWIEGSRKVTKWRWHTVIPNFCNAAFAWWAQAAFVAHGLETRGVTWTPPRREMIDPVKETAARKDQIRSGLLPYREALREDGYDPDEVMAEIALGNEQLDQLGIVLDSDPRRDKGSTSNDGQEEDDTEGADGIGADAAE